MAKEKHFFGLVFQWAGGIKSHLIFLCCFFILSGSCQFLNNSIFSPSEQSESDENDGDDEESNEENPDKEGGAPKQPNSATAWDTQVLLLSNQLPGSERIQSCRQNVENLSANANDATSLINARESLATTVSEQFTLYHWCFFILMHQVDTQLESVGSTLKAKADFFLSKMQQLWILARALDAYDSEEIYFQYLRDRYIQISQSTFGRGLSIIGKSMDSLPRPQWTPQKSVLQNSFGNPESQLEDSEIE